MLHKFRIALAVTLLALAAASAVDSASAGGARGEVSRPMLDPTADNTDVYAFTGAP
jgi:hypothetical protein